jgi:hypothetical protein
MPWRLEKVGFLALFDVGMTICMFCCEIIEALSRPSASQEASLSHRPAGRFGGLLIFVDVLLYLPRDLVQRSFQYAVVIKIGLS